MKHFQYTSYYSGYLYFEYFYLEIYLQTKCLFHKWIYKHLLHIFNKTMFLFKCIWHYQNLQLHFLRLLSFYILEYIQYWFLTEVMHHITLFKFTSCCIFSCIEILTLLNLYEFDLRCLVMFSTRILCTLSTFIVIQGYGKLQYFNQQR